MSRGRFGAALPAEPALTETPGRVRASRAWEPLLRRRNAGPLPP